MSDFTFRGLGGFRAFADRLIRGGKKIPRSTVPSVINNVAAKILMEAKSRAPVRTGALRASGRIEPASQPGSTYAVAVAFGGQGTNVNYAAVIEYGRVAHAPMPPRPFLRPAVAKTMRETRGKLRRSLEDSLKSLGGSF